MMRLALHKNTSKDYHRAQCIRNDPSPIENKLWRALRSLAKTHNLKFRRQQPVHPFIADFACMEIKLIVELDGDSHIEQIGYDRARDKYLQNQGYTILRLSNGDVVNNAESAASAIVDKALILRAQQIPPPSPGSKRLANDPVDRSTREEREERSAKADSSYFCG